MSDPVSRLQLVQQEIDKTFGSGFAHAHPEVLIAALCRMSPRHSFTILESRNPRRRSCARGDCARRSVS
jgi:hypothetical protein